MIAATSALAPSFVHTTESPDIRLAFTSGTSPVDVTIPSGTYRMCLAPAASDFLRVIQSRINTALSGAGRAETVAVTLSAAGIVTLTVSPATALSSLSFPSDFVRYALGFSVAPASHPAVGDYPAWYLALFASLSGYAPMPKQQGGAETDGAGVTYTFANGATSWRQNAEATLIPWTPAMRAAQGCEGTAMYPAEGYLGALGAVDTAREWSLLDVLRVSRNALCGVALGTWPAIRTSTTLPVWRSYVAPATLLSPEIKRAERAVEVWCELELALTHPATATETRA